MFLEWVNETGLSPAPIGNGKKIDQIWRTIRFFKDFDVTLRTFNPEPPNQSEKVTLVLVQHVCECVLCYVCVYLHVCVYVCLCVCLHHVRLTIISLSSVSPAAASRSTASAACPLTLIVASGTISETSGAVRMLPQHSRGKHWWPIHQNPTSGGGGSNWGHWRLVLWRNASREGSGLFFSHAAPLGQPQVGCTRASPTSLVAHVSVSPDIWEKRRMSRSDSELDLCHVRNPDDTVLCQKWGRRRVVRHGDFIKTVCIFCNLKSTSI